MALVLGLAALAGGPFADARAQGIEQLLIENVPVPTPRPDRPGESAAARTTEARPATEPVSSGRAPTAVAARRGSLKDGLDALSDKDTNTARAIRAGVKPGSLDRQILAWAIALSGREEVGSAEIAAIAADLPDWPGQRAMRIHAERALVREAPPARAIVTAFGSRAPENIEGGLLLAQAHLTLGNRAAARAAIAPFWREKVLSREQESEILSSVGDALDRADHRHRMHWLFYRDRATAAGRVASLAEQVSLARARTAVLRRAKDADAKLAAVAASSKRDTGYLFARIEHARRSGDARRAAALLLTAPKDPKLLVNANEWWVERRIVSRQLIDAGDALTAYQVAAGYVGGSKVNRAEAEFHAGWYALRFLKNRALARRHFANILQISQTPISQARGLYWLGRASSGATAQGYFRDAAKHRGTYYGQLAAIELGRRNFRIARTRPTAGDRERYRSRLLVQAIERLEAVDHGWRADIIYRHLAGRLDSAGEIALLSAAAERAGKPNVGLQIGKIAYRRGLQVETAAWPLGALPASAQLGVAGQALAYAIARQESAFNKAAISPAGARGLLQLMPGTAKLMARRTGVKYSRRRLTRDAAYNASLGAAYLDEQLETFDGSYVLTIAAYNAGPRRSEEWVAKYGDPRGKPIHEVVDWVERIPFTETRNYVQRVMENYQIYKARISRSRLEIDRDLSRGRRS